ncbi:MAG: hypothetical protein K1Y01_04205 [Vicinamibacteria bacterium]|nr:hypothetical protein [Vicinamibacteria bacterium]
MTGLIWLFLAAASAAPLASPTPQPPLSPGAPPAGFVVIPVDDYRALRSRAYPLEPEPGPPPVEWALSRIDCDLRVDGDSASGEARLTVDVMKDGWVRLPLPRNLKVRSARVDGRPVALVAEPGRDPSILLSKVGRVVLILDIATPMVSQSGGESFALPASNAGVFRVLARIPRPAVDLSVAGGVTASKEETDSETRVSVSVRPGENLQLSWRRRAEARRSTLPPRFRSTLTEVVGLGEENATITANSTLEMIQGEATAVSFSLPTDFVVNQVSGALVADWDFKPGALSITFLEAVETSTRLVMLGESKAPREGSMSIPLVRMNGAERETGGVAVEVLGAGEIKAQRAQGLDPTDPSELGEALAGRDSPSLVAFRFRPLVAADSRALSLDVARYTPQAVLLANVEEARYDSLVTDEGKRLTRARYAIRNNQRSFLAVNLPRGALLWSASVAGKPVRPGLSPSGALLLPLQKTRGGEEAPPFAAEVIYFERAEPWLRNGNVSIALPSLDLPISRTGVVFHHSPEFRLTFDRGAFRQAEFESPISPALTGIGLVPGAPPMAAPEKRKDERDQAFQSLVDQFRQESRSGRMSSSLPVQVALPQVGSLVFLTSELTAEGASPSIGFAYQKGGRQ